MTHRPIRRLLLLLISCIAIKTTQAAELYFTDFDTFNVGTNQWVGTDGWSGGNTSGGVTGIDDAIIPGLNKQTAFLGFNQPAATLVSVFRNFNYDHVANNTPVIEIETLIGIQDSTNNRRDSFLLSIFNASGTRIAALQFDNANTTFGIWRQDGTTTRTDTGATFNRNSLHLIYLTINLTNNTWPATIHAIPIFTDAPSHAGPQAVNFGIFAYQWDLTGLLPAAYGDNWLLVSDLSITAIPQGVSPFTVSAVTINPLRITWPGEVGFDYQVEYAELNAGWTNTLANSFFTGLSSPAPLTFTDSLAPTSSNRQYRVVRSISP